MRKSTNGFVMLLAAVMALGLSLGYAQAKNNHHHKKRRHPHKAFAKWQEQAFKGITLSSDQKSKIQADFDAYVKEAHAWNKQHGAERRDLVKQLRAARKSGDKQKVKQIHQQLRQLMSTHPKLKDTMAKVKSELTADQQKQYEANLKQMREERRARRKAHHKGHHNGKKKNNSDKLNI